VAPPLKTQNFVYWGFLLNIMKSIVYILYSESLDRYYIGSTVLEVSERLERHISNYYGNTKYTHKAKDWDIYLTIYCESKNQARRIEYYIKRMKSRKYIENLKSFPENTQALLSRFKNEQD
jgi:putative endonuclease